MSSHNERDERGEPPPIKPESVLDSIFRKDGPMPPAGLALRGLALLLDVILMTIVASIVIWKIVLPQSHPGAFGEYLTWSQEVSEWATSALQSEPLSATEKTERFESIPQPSKELAGALAVGHELFLLVFWVYFAFGEAFFKGSSLGKRICRIRSVSTVTLGPPQVLPGIVRGGLKTVALFWLFPLAFGVTFIALFFNKRRQLGHDLCARTAVVDEKYVILQPKP